MSEDGRGWGATVAGLGGSVDSPSVASAYGLVNPPPPAIITNSIGRDDGAQLAQENFSSMDPRPVALWNFFAGLIVWLPMMRACE